MADGGPDERKGNRASSTIAFPLWPVPLNRPVSSFTIGANLASLASLQLALKSSLLPIYDLERGWKVVFDTSITYILPAMYSIQIMFFMLFTKWLWSRESGIRSNWDPTNLADKIALFSHFNISVSFIKPSLSRFGVGQLSDNYNFRLGYWEMIHQNTTSVVYGICGVGKLRHRKIKLSNCTACGSITIRIARKTRGRRQHSRHLGDIWL